MTENTVVRGGSKVLDSAQVREFGKLLLHTNLYDHAVVAGHATVIRSQIRDRAIIDGTAQVKDALVGGDTRLTVEFVGRHGHVLSNAHVVYVRLHGEGFTIHRVFSKAKGFGAQLVREDGEKVTGKALKEMVQDNPDFKALQVVLNQCKRSFADS